jgi:hypothetical protein
MNKLKLVLLALQIKLWKYYTKITNIHIYLNRVIFQSYRKLILFD